MPPKDAVIPRTARKTPLNRARIVNAAIAFADEHGLQALSMRSLARNLGFGVMSLYNHVADKDDLIDAMVDAATGEIDIDTTCESWRETLRTCLISAYKVMLRHRWLPKEWSRFPGPAKNHYHEAILRTMRQADFPEPLACQGFHALTMHVVGFALQVLEMPFSNQEELAALGRQALDDLDEQAYPYLREHVHFHLSGQDERNDFKYMLDLILDGLERELTELT